MELKDVLLNRRSIRKFTDKEISDDIINELMIAAMSAPSACNRQPWEFYIVRDEEVREKLRKSSLFTRKNGKVGIVVCGNLEKALPGEMADYWIQDCSAAVQSILLRVTDLGLGAVWCGLYPQEKAVIRAKEALNLEDHIIPIALIWLGYKDEELEPRTQYDESKIHYI